MSSLLGGILVGLVCVGGLALAFQCILQGQKQAQKWKRAGLITLGAVFAVAQFFLALGLLLETHWVKEGPVFLCVGFVGTILLSGPLLAKLSRRF